MKKSIIWETVFLGKFVAVEEYQHESGVFWEFVVDDDEYVSELEIGSPAAAAKLAFAYINGDDIENDDVL